MYELTVINLIFITKTVTCVAIRILRGLFSTTTTTLTTLTTHAFHSIIIRIHGKKKKEKWHLRNTRIYWCKEMEDTEKFVILWHHWKLYLYSSGSELLLVYLRKHVAMSLYRKTAPREIKWYISELSQMFLCFFPILLLFMKTNMNKILWRMSETVTTVYTFLGNIKLKPLQ